MEFCGSNLRIARLYRGFTQEELGEMASVSGSMIGHAERGVQPSDMVVDALALALGFRPGFFFRPLPYEFTVNDCHFRSLVSAAERLRKQVLARGSLFGGVVNLFHSELELKDFSIPQIAVKSDDDIEAAAEYCRTHWGLGTNAPISRMTRVLERNGVMVRKLPGESNKLDAFSTRPLPNCPSFVVLTGGTSSGDRLRFDMAHELGHLVMHPNMNGTLKERERQADRFASAFLLPRDGFGREFWAGGKINWHHVFQLKGRWKVSAQAIIYRAKDLNLIDAIEFRRAYQMISVRGWRKNEPYEIPAEEPELFTKAMTVLLERKGRSLESIAFDLEWEVETLRDITQWSQDTKEVPLSGPRLVQ